jgi:uncharacterized protein DUF349
MTGTEPTRPAGAEAPDLGFGRVDADGTVYVRTSAGERPVGQWPGGDPEAALTFYRNRFAGLAAQVDLLEKRVASGALPAAAAAKAVDRLRATVQDAQAVGDLDSLATRLDGLAPALERAREVQRAERAAKAKQTHAAREALVERAEALATSTQWTSGPAMLNDLVEQWKALARTDKSRDEELWQRFAAARTAYTRRRRQHFAELDEKRKISAAAKEKLIAEAEELSTSTDWSPTTRAFRDLMARWKAAGPARRDAEEGLWRRFRAAQDAFFTARNAQQAEVDAEYTANAEVKRSLLADAEKLLPVRDPRASREAFRALALRWDAAGKVPRHELKDLEARFGRVDAEIRRAEDDRWRRRNPEGSARAATAVAQLETSIAAVRERLAAAESRGDERAASQARADLEARESWLVQARKSLTELDG